MGQPAFFLSALKRLVYDEKRGSMQDLRRAMDNNFQGQESLRLLCLRHAPK